MHEIATVGASLQKENKRAVWQLVHGCERLSPPSRLAGIGKMAGSPPSNVVKRHGYFTFAETCARQRVRTTLVRSVRGSGARMPARVDFEEIMMLVQTLSDDELRALAGRITEEARVRGIMPRRHAASPE